MVRAFPYIWLATSGSHIQPYHRVILRLYSFSVTNARDTHKIRVATVEDLEDLAAMNQRAFINSPTQTFLAGLRAVNTLSPLPHNSSDVSHYQPLTTEISDKAAREIQTVFIKFLIRRSWSLNARFTVLVVPGNDGKEKIVASTIWPPPIPPVAPKAPSTLSAIRMGLFSVLKYWGFGVMGASTRTGYGFPVNSTFLPSSISPSLFSQATTFWNMITKRRICLERRTTLGTSNLQELTQRLMSSLLREAFEHAPGATFTLEATTPASRDVYQHFGFEVVCELIVTKGKVDARGKTATLQPVSRFILRFESNRAEALL
ncbi:hypothetical protein V5O48_011690 [Marasmius crinis-equi]|uniref:N-acetyltransferase domain-containing protein n=1 Tax=Marasmius crinis-equi TaxID=585013 RepID=A0ABR3F4W1_9AGAR